MYLSGITYKPKISTSHLPEEILADQLRKMCFLYGAACKVEDETELFLCRQRMKSLRTTTETLRDRLQFQKASIKAGADKTALVEQLTKLILLMSEPAPGALKHEAVAMHERYSAIIKKIYHLMTHHSAGKTGLSAGRTTELKRMITSFEESVKEANPGNPYEALIAECGALLRLL